MKSPLSLSKKGKKSDVLSLVIEVTLSTSHLSLKHSCRIYISLLRYEGWFSEMFSIRYVFVFR